MDASLPPAQASSRQRAARVVAGTALALLGAWVLHRFLGALAWGLMIAIATWPLYVRFSDRSTARRREWAALFFTLLVALLLVAPFVYLVFEAIREAQIFAHWLAEGHRQGMEAPPWMTQLPYAGKWLGQRWNDVIVAPDGLAQLLGRIDSKSLAGRTWTFGGHLVHRLMILGFALVTLFFLYRDGAALGREALAVAHRVLGDAGERYADHVFAAVRATVNGLVLVGIGEGVLLGVAYELAGVPHAALLGALTGLLAMIPFAAPLVFGAVALALFAAGNTGAALAIFGFGAAVIFVADHFVRPALIGGAAKLPFLWVLLGILGGLETFGLLGLFLGPAVMAALVAVWRDCVAESMSERSTQAPVLTEAGARPAPNP